MKWFFFFWNVGCNVVLVELDIIKVINDGVIIVKVIELFDMIENVGVIFI